jgi:hypothetical protein
MTGISDRVKRVFYSGEVLMGRFVVPGTKMSIFWVTGIL